LRDTATPAIHSLSLHDALPISFMTSHYPSRHLIHGHISDEQQNVARSMPNWLDAEVTTLPDLLKSAGYATGHFGKWHLGSGPGRSEEHTSELQSRENLVCRLLL